MKQKSGLTGVQDVKQHYSIVGEKKGLLAIASLKYFKINSPKDTLHVEKQQCSKLSKAQAS